MYSLYQGDRSKIKRISVSGYSSLDGDWTGKMVVRESLATDPIVDKVITHDGSEFTAVILPSESELLSSSKKYIWIIEIENTALAIPFRKEIHEEIAVIAQGVE